jgi:TPR repeat protein
MKPQTEERVTRYSVYVIRVVQIVGIVVVVLVALSQAFEQYGSYKFKKGLAAFEQKDYGAAKSNFNSAEVESQGRAEFYLATMNRDGLGMPKNQQDAIAWFEKAFQQGTPAAGLALAILYGDDKSGVADEVKATSWYLKAADAGNLTSMCYGGYRLITGVGTKVDEPRGYNYIHKAALEGDRTAQYYTGLVTYQGQGTAADPVAAFGWIEIAAARGEPGAAQSLEELKTKLDPSLMAKAVQMSADLKNTLGKNAL